MERKPSGKMKKRLIWALVAALVIALGIASAIRYSDLNRTFPSRERMRIPAGQSVIIFDEMEISAGNPRVMMDEDFYEKYNIPEEDRWPPLSVPMKYVLVDVEMTNHGSWDPGRYSDGLIVRAGNMVGTGNIMQVYAICENFRHPAIGETVRFTLPFNIMYRDTGAHARLWENLENEPLLLSFSTNRRIYLWELQ